MDGLRYQGVIEADVPDFHQDTTQVAVPPCDILALRLDSERFKDLDVVITTRQSMTLMHGALRSKNLPALDILRISVDADVTRGTRGFKALCGGRMPPGSKHFTLSISFWRFGCPPSPLFGNLVSIFFLVLFPYNLTTSSMLSAPCRNFDTLHVSVYWHLKTESLFLRISKWNYLAWNILPYHIFVGRTLSSSSTVSHLGC